ncbi:hypothetical protein BD311DRAFT_748979 [Dichomitus squalens]|uniref:Uncharacterized protein n=1 Tax=Dichomitus squalens TaxID=114155 RepID=A0A4Q9N1B2_9APHY|nr:hypothetical protein BD311DRAFT_748979 [Dichomitus squalens]
MLAGLLLTAAAALPLATAHIAFFHPSMYGFNVTQQTFPYDNRPVAPLMNMNFQQWWFHGHLDYPPNPGDIFELPAGKPATTQLSCDKGETTFFASSPGGNVQAGNNPCTGDTFPSGAMHTTGFDDLKGCALAIAYESDVTKIQPENFTVFSVNQTCVWNRFTDFQVPERMPPCPPGGCHCAWFWIHSPDSGGEQNYMNGFKCNITGSTSNVALAQPQVPRRCGADPTNGKPNAAPGNCTYGAKQPFYWFQTERNNMFEGTYSPPFYTDLYNFKDGAQNDIFEDSYPQGLPPPSPNSTFVPTPFLGNGSGNSTAGGASYPVVSSSPSGSSSVPATSSGAAGSSSTGFISSTTTGAVGSFSSGSVSSTAGSASFTAIATTLPVSSSLASSSVVQGTPDLPLSTTSAAISFPTSSLSASSVSQPLTGNSQDGPASTSGSSDSASVTAPESTSVVLSTSIVLSTVLVTVTATPVPTRNAGSASPTLSFSDSIPATASTGTLASASSISTQLVPTQGVSLSASDAASTIVLNFPTGNASPTTSVLMATAPIPRAALLAARTSCKREPGRSKVFRRRPSAKPFSSNMDILDAREEKPAADAVLGMHKHKMRRLGSRSRLWNLF